MKQKFKFLSLLCALMLMCTGQAMAYESWTSTNHANNSTSEHTWNISVTAGQYIKFNYSVSSEDGWDWLTITIDGNEVVHKAGEATNTYYYHCSSSETITMTASYSKDGSNSDGSDQGTVSGIEVVNQMPQVSLTLADATIGLSVSSNISWYSSPETNLNLNLNLTWTSSNPFVATVDNNGRVTGLKVGTATITATAKDGSSVSASCTVTVNIPGISSIDTIVVSRAGTLGGEALKIRKNLKEFSAICVVGPFDEYDWKTIDEMGLTYLDLTDAEDTAYPATVSSTIMYVKMSKYITEIKHNPFQNVRYMYVPEEVTKISATKFTSNSEFVLDGCDGVTSIPAHAFDNSKISYASFASLTEVPEYAFYQCQYLGFVNLPEVTKIGDYAFEAYSTNYANLTSISAPKLEEVGTRAFYCQNMMQNAETLNLKKIGENAFYYCQQLKDVDLSGAKSVPTYAFYECNSMTVPSLQSLETIGSYAFYNCRGIQEAIIPNVTTVNDYSFAGCSGLTALDARRATRIGIKAFEECSEILAANLSSAERIDSCAFRNNTKLREINLPQVSFLDRFAFYGCRAATSINMSDKLTQIGDQSFYGCIAAEQITLPASLMHLPSQCFSGSTNIKVINCNAPAPPTVGDVPFYMQTVYTATLRVPESSLKLYQSDFYWKHFYYMETNPDEVTDLTIRTEIPYGENRFDKINLTIAVGGALEMSGTKSQAFRSVTFEADKNGAGAFLSNTQRISSDATKMALNMEGLKWYFFTLPFDAQITDIDNTNDAQLAIYSYDGAHRAQYGTGGNWTRHTSGTLSANKGYIVQASKATEITFKATYETRNSAFLQGDKSIALDANTSSTASNKGWNYIGNPYSTYYDISYMDFSAPITVWNGSTYQAYSVEDDEFALKPMQSFFVQCPTNVTAIAFDKDGRQTNGTVQRPAAAKGVKSQRKVIDIVLSDNSNSDRTRIVVNKEATDDYDMERDAAKMMSMDETVPQLYTERDGEQYAINEGPQSAGTVDLGLYIPAAGKYTIKATRSDINAYIVDAQTGKRVLLAEGYTFEAEQGMMTERMSIELAADEDVTGVATETADDAEAQDIYDLSGKKLDGKKAGINIIRRGENVKKSVVR